jgi:hypothetical protein
MSKNWKIFFGCLAFLFVAFWLLMMYMLEKPKVTVDYFTEYNELTRPDPFDKKQNAADLLDKLPRPELKEEEIWKIDDFMWSYEPSEYPDKFTPDDIEKIKSWINAHKKTLEAIVGLSQKPYYYRPVDPSLYRTELLQYQFYSYGNDYDIGRVGRMLSWAFVYYSREGDYDAAVKYLKASLDLYKIYNRRLGLYQQFDVYSLLDGFDSLFASAMNNQTMPPEAWLAIQQLLEETDFHADFDIRVPRLCFLDYMQKTYTEGDHGHPAPLVLIKNEVGIVSFSAIGPIAKCFTSRSAAKVGKKLSAAWRPFLTGSTN